jgi:hypothetical protein
MAVPSTTTETETKVQKFERHLSGAPFDGLKAIFAALTPDREALSAAVQTAHSYEELLSRLGYRMTLVNQIHIQDCYGRVGPKGGIKAVLPYYDIPTQASLPTLVNFDSTITTTPKAATYFNNMLASLKKQLSSEG